MSLEDEPLVKYDSTNNIYHIIKPTQILHSQPKPLKLVQNDIVNHLKKEQRYIINNKLYTEITDKLNKGTKFTDIMVEHNLKSTNHKIRYNDFKEPIENELLTEIQQLKPGEITHLFNIHGKTKFAFFKKIIISDHNGDINKMKDLIDNEIKNEIIQQYVNHLYQEYKVKVNANSINAL
jgi:hypothetical protein